MKECKTCKTIKSLIEFYKAKGSRDGYNSNCIVCFKQIVKKYRKVNTKSNDFYKNNKNWHKEWYKKNKDKIRQKRTIYINSKRKLDSLFKFKEDVKTRIRMSFNNKGIRKDSNTKDILGCSIKEFREYIESKFEPWMNWDNKGNPKDGILEINKSWDLDHIIPLSTAKTKEDIIRLNHYTNFQPMCSYTNRYIKSDN